MTDQETAENELLQLLEQLADLVLAGDHEECQRVIKQHPQHAEELESVLPAIRLMHDVKSCDASATLSNQRLSTLERQSPISYLFSRIRGLRIDSGESDAGLSRSLSLNTQWTIYR